MGRKFACASLLILLLMPGVFGCQMKTTGIKQSDPAAGNAAGEQLTRNDGLTAAVLKSVDDKVAYSAGLDAGMQLQKIQLDINSINHLIQGIKDSLLGNEPLLTNDERTRVRSEFLAVRAERTAKELGAQAEINLAAGKRFLQENAKKEGVKTLASGLQYRILKEGNGTSPHREQKVTVHYVVKGIEGTEYDSTYKSGTPASIVVANTPLAWAETLQLMKTGEKWEVYSPGFLAYGENGVGENIGAFQPLIFELELIAVH